MINGAKICVVLPAYNAARTLERTLAAIDRTLVDDVIVVDEFHHAAADTYERVLEHLRPKILLGLTATPERADGLSVLGWFDDRIAAEMAMCAAGMRAQ